MALPIADVEARATATRAGLWLGWLSIAAVAGELLLGLEGIDRTALLGLTGAAAAFQIAVSLVPWRRCLEAARGLVLLDVWSAGLLVFVGVLVGVAGANASFDLLFFLVVPFLAVVQTGRRRQLWLAAAAIVFALSTTLTRHPLTTEAIVLRASLLVAAVTLALALDRVARREAAARAEIAARAELEHLLLAEAHHRVKNSLQTVADLLLLAQPDGEAADAFERMSGRVRSIAAVHRLLTESRGGAVSSYALLRAIAEAVDPTIEVEADRVELDAETAQRLGIVANELLVNAIAHGAPPVRLTFAAGPPSRLEVSDAGSLPGDRRDGLGLGLVRQISERALRGSFTLGHADGRTSATVLIGEESPCAS